MVSSIFYKYPCKIQVIVLLITPVFCTAESYDSVVAFGDSLTDNGNLKAFVAAINEDFAQYVRERYTDDKVWVEYFTEQIGAQLDDNAFAGATTDGHENEIYDPIYGDQLGLIGQVKTYLEENDPMPDALYAIWIGGNDMLGLPLATGADGVAAAVANAISNVEDAITDLAMAGARDFLIPNLPDLGKTPSYNRDPIAVANATAATRTYNDALAAMLSSLEPRLEQQTNVDIVFYTLDVFGLLNEEVLGQGVFANDTDSWMDDGQDEDVTDYLFWDEIHPTSGGHRMVAEKAAELVTGNAADEDDDDSSSCFVHTAAFGAAGGNYGWLALMALGGIGLVTRRRR
jgi:MYXO-CTERM domain-containing protein